MIKVEYEDKRIEIKNEIDLINEPEQTIINYKIFKLTAYLVKYNNMISHYCGYIEFNDNNEHDDDIFYSEDIEKLTHGGWTANKGFDCAHFGDIMLGDFFIEEENNSTFKSKEYVFDKLKKIADAVIIKLNL